MHKAADKVIVCSHCNASKPLSEYHIFKENTDNHGRAYSCKACVGKRIRIMKDFLED